MKIILLFLLPILKLTAFGSIDEDQAWQKFHELASANEKNLIDLGKLKSVDEKKIKFTSIIKPIVDSMQFNMQASGANNVLQLVHWKSINRLESFFSDQYGFLLEKEFAKNSSNFGKIQFIGYLISNECSSGEEWFKDWLFDIIASEDSYLKWIAYWAVEDFGVDYRPNTEEDNFVSDLESWKSAFESANDLGKAIIIKCATSLANDEREWSIVGQMHLSLLKGKNEMLKAISIVKGAPAMGDEVIDHWRGIANESKEEKLKALAKSLLSVNRLNLNKP